MRKLVSLAVVLTALTTSIFARGFFDQRYFEIVTNVPLGISNNAISMNDFMVKDLVIDLGKIADEMPEDGFKLNMNADPSLAINLNVPLFSLGFKTGVDVSSSANISKDLFDYIGKGNALYEKVKVDTNINADVFTYEEINVGFKVKRFKILAKPTFFMPLVHVTTKDSYVSIENNVDGDLLVEMNTNLEVYSFYDFDKKEMANMPGIGFDIGAEVSYPLFDYLTITGKTRIPFIPGQLKSKSNLTASMKYKTSVQDCINGDLGDPEKDSAFSAIESTSYKINRPFKLAGFADFTPFGDWFVVTGGLGFGIKHPFASDKDEIKGYAEYYLGAKVNFINFVEFNSSMEYTDELFKNQIGFKFNVRIMEIDAGVNLQSNTFAKSWNGSGYGGYLTFALGF